MAVAGPAVRVAVVAVTAVVTVRSLELGPALALARALGAVARGVVEAAVTRCRRAEETVGISGVGT